MFVRNPNVLVLKSPVNGGRKHKFLSIKLKDFDRISSIEVGYQLHINLNFYDGSTKSMVVG